LSSPFPLEKKKKKKNYNMLYMAIYTCEVQRNGNKLFYFKTMTFYCETLVLPNCPITDKQEIQVVRYNDRPEVGLYGQALPCLGYQIRNQCPALILDA